MKKLILLASIAFAGIMFIIASPFSAGAESSDNPRNVGSTLETHIFDDGKVLVRGAKVTAVSGSVISAATTWGSLTLNWTVNTDASTEIVRKQGGRAAITEVSVGDYVSFQGMLVTTASTPTVQARIVKNWSIQKAKASFFGTIESFGVVSGTFMLKTEERGVIQVTTSATTKVQKGESAGTLGDLAVGIKVQVKGLMNSATNTFEAETIRVFVERSVERRVYQGRLKSIAEGVPPPHIILTIDGVDYQVNIAVDTSILNNAWGRATVVQFKIGDQIRVYGAKEEQGKIIEATVVRNTSLR